MSIIKNPETSTLLNEEPKRTYSILKIELTTIFLTPRKTPHFNPLPKGLILKRFQDPGFGALACSSCLSQVEIASALRASQ
mgnify:CR=1 FL=1